jgi:hypothetical protein
MLKKDVDIKWTQEDKLYFERIKQALIESHVLIDQTILKSS